MRSKDLDTSHRCLIENLQTFHRMERAYKEIGGYINDVLQELATDLNQKQQTVNFDESTIPRGWFEASDVPNWKKSEDYLVTIGLEGFKEGPDSIVGSSLVDQCRAHVYSRYYWSIDDDAAIDQLRRKLELPEGFVVAKERGYVFTRNLDELPVEDFCNRQTLTKYFREPLNLLVEWLARNKQPLMRAAEAVGR